MAPGKGKDDMHKHGEELHFDETEASAGTRSGIVVKILGASLLIAIVGLSAVWIIPALTQ